jgi:topoisomerase-4 subunit B
VSFANTAIFCRGVKLSAEDIWERCAYVLSVKMQDPQFAWQTKERLSSRQCAAFVSGVVKDAFSLWLNQNVQAAEMLAEMAISSAQRRLRAAKKVVRKKSPVAPPLQANSLTVPLRISTVPSCSWWKVIRRAVRQAGARS